MPTIEKIDGLKIVINNGDHRPPHVHAIYNEFEALIIIETCLIYAGGLPTKQMKRALNWVAVNQDWALSLFYELNPELK